MASFGQIIFYSMVSLIAVFTAVIILILTLSLTRQKYQVLSSNTKPIGNLGEDAVMDCYLYSNTLGQTTFSKVSVTWEKKDVEGQVFLYEEGAPHLQNQASEFKGRTDLFTESLISGNASLLLRSVRLSDEGEYTCRVGSSDGGGEINIHFKTAAFSAPTFTLSDGIVTATANRWYPQPNVTWLNGMGSLLNGSTSFTERALGIFTVFSSLKPPRLNETYSCRIQNEVVLAVGDVTVTNTGVTARTYFVYGVAASLLASVYLVVIVSVLCIYCLV